MSIISRVLRISRMIVASLLIVLIAALITLWWLTGSKAGTQWILRTALSQTEQITIGQIDGTLLNELRLEKVHYQDHNDFSVTVKNATLKWLVSDLFRGHFHVQALRLEDIFIEGQPAASETEQSNSEIPSIPLSISVDQFNIERLIWLNNDDRQEISRLAVRAQLRHNTLKLSDLGLTMPHLQADAQATVGLQADWPISAELTWAYHLDEAKLKGHLKSGGNLDRFEFDSHIDGDAKAEQHGFIVLSTEQPKFDVSGEWQKLRWPLQGAAQVSSDQGSFRLAGSLEQYRTELQAKVKVQDQPDFSVTLNGNGDQDSLEIRQLRLQPKQGQIELSGHLSWTPAVVFNLALTAEKLNPADFGGGVPGRLNLRATSQGKIAGERYDVELAIDKLNGQLNDQPVNAAGQLKLVDHRLNIPQLNLSSGPNQLSVNGQIDEQTADLALRIAAPNLHAAWPALAGRLNGGATLKGSLRKPQINAAFQGRQLRYADQRIARLSLQADYRHASERPSSLDLVAEDLRLGETTIQRIDLQGNGTQINHKMNLRLRSDQGDLRIAAHGEWNESRWLGQLERFDIDQPQLKSWHLLSPVAIEVEKLEQNYRIALPETCLIQDTAHFCVATFGVPASQLEGHWSLTDWPLTATKTWLPEKTSLSGTVSAQGRFSTTENEQEAELHFTVGDGEASFTDEHNMTYRQSFTVPSIQLRYLEDQLDGSLRLNLGEKDYIAASVHAGQAKANDVRSLKGSLQGKIADMKILDSLLLELNQIEGQLLADLTLSGDSQHPLIEGSAQWQNGRFEIPRLGETFRNITLRADSDKENSERLLLSAHIESGKGQLTGNGHLDLLAEQNFPLSLSLTGQRFQVVRLPEAEATISPHLTINKRGALTNVDGQIKIDSATVEINSLPESAIAPSEDEIIIGRSQPKQKDIVPSQLQTRIAIDFGDKTHFTGFGLKTRLSGKLQYVTKDDQQRLLGRAQMLDATYRSYGQDLTIRKGEFIFNGPTDNPWMNIEATRKALKDDVTAVLSVTGPLKSPQTRVYSEPSLSESEALSYLVTGKSSDSLSKSDGNALASAAFSYGAGQLSWISDKLGIDEFEFEQGETISDSAVRLGEYFNPDLYVGVTMGLFASTYAADIKYRLSKHFSLESRAGENQSISLKYLLETD